MSTNQIQIDAVERTFIAPANVTSGTPLVIGNLFVIPKASASSGDTFAAYVAGRHSVPKTNAQAWAQGDPIYWSGTTTTNVQTGVLKQIGQAGAVAANPSTTGYVDINEGTEADSDVGTLIANLASTTDAAKGTALVGDATSGGTLKAKLDTCTTQAAVAGGAGTLPHYAGASRVLADSLIASANVVTQAAAAAGAGTIPTYAGASKVLQDSTVALANLPTMAAVGGAGNLLQTAAADRAVSDAGVAVANLATMAAAGGAGEILYTAAADRAVAKAGITVSALSEMVGGVVLPAGPLNDAGTNAISIAIQVNGPDGTPIGHVARVEYTTSNASLGADAALFNQATTATTGVIGFDDTIAAGYGAVHTDATGAAVIVIGHAAGALANKFLNVWCAGFSDSVDVSFT